MRLQISIKTSLLNNYQSKPVCLGTGSTLSHARFMPKMSSKENATEN